MKLDPLDQQTMQKIEDALNNFQNASKLQTSEELHYYAAAYHFEDGHFRTLKWVIDHPLCDLGTALIIYWNLHPEYFYAEYDNREAIVNRYDLEQYDLIKEIEEKVLSGYFKRQHLGYPISALRKKDWKKIYALRYQKQLIPEQMVDFAPAELGYEGE